MGLECSVDCFRCHKKGIFAMTARLSPRSADAVFALYYAETRAHLLETAAALDRFDRYDPEETLQHDPRYLKLQRALEILADGKPNRTERFLDAFSEDL